MRLQQRIATVGLLVSLNACDCGEPLVVQKPSVDQIDIFEQKAAAKVDILWIVDNSESMLSEQSKVAAKFNEFFNQLITSQVDYHIGVVTTDPADGGKLRRYVGPVVSTCDGCRFITKATPCDDPAVSIAGLTTETEIENKLLDKCEAQLLFRKLISVGSGGSSSEQAFEMAATALGVRDVDFATGLPLHNPPVENVDFVRDDAALYIVFVSDEEEGNKADGSPIRYYQRLFEALKGAGNENKVAVAAIVGYPDDQQNPPPIDEVCDILATTFDSSVANDDPRVGDLEESFRSFTLGCTDENGDPGDASNHAETGGRFIELACRTGGVVADMCNGDYSTALDELGANAAGLLRKFTLSRFQDMELGADCDALSGDEPKIDCDEDDKTNGELDSAICVKAQCLGADKASLLPQDNATGWRFEKNTSSIRFDGSCLPAPGSKVEVRYLLARKNTCQ